MTTRFLWLFIFSLLLSSCCLGGRDDFKEDIRSEVRALIPYTDLQKINFLSSSGDTLLALVNITHKFSKYNCAECFCFSTEVESLTFDITQADSSRIASIYVEGNNMILQFAFSDGYLAPALDYTGTIVCDSTLDMPVHCLDSIVIQGVTYTSVYQIDSLARPDIAIPISMLYQVEKGVIRISRGNGDIIDVL